MINLTESAQYLHNLPSENKRDPKYKKADIAAVHALTQAAVHVELFTIPLYMTSMYSIQGMHQINEGNDFYEGRLWPGPSTSVLPEDREQNRYLSPEFDQPAVPPGQVDTDNFFNKKSFNTIFSVFIQEMLHLQLAANICTALNKNAAGESNTFDPTFTGPPLQAKEIDGGFQNAWTCYGPDKTQIPHIVDLTDLKHEKIFGDDYLALDEIKVKLGALDTNSISLFMAIEADHQVVKDHMKPEALPKYFPKAPFSEELWNADSTELDLPMFGTIAHMYSCLAIYLNLEYSDGSTLFSAVFNSESAQQDLFNFSNRKGGKGKAGHPCAEFSAMGDLTVTAADPTNAKKQIFNMISGIIDQGEGGPLEVEPTDVEDKNQMLLGTAPAATAGDRNAVNVRYQPDRFALEADYPSYDDTGERCPYSADAQARSIGGEQDHFARFKEVAMYVAQGKITTWEQWHANPENKWSAELLVTDPKYLEEASKYNIAKPEDVATALNNLKYKKFGDQDATASAEFSEDNFKLFSHVAAGSIAGITSVLDTFWNYENFIKNPIDFPYPSMSGSGDRISICWAIFGKAPDLALGAFPRKSGIIPSDAQAPVNHACQGLGFLPDGSQDMDQMCGTKGVFHTCKGSNQCAGEGGCGFVHDATIGGGGCGGSSSGPSTGLFSAPGGNKCGSLGGCAVPMSDSQLLPEDGEMQLFKLDQYGENCLNPECNDNKTDQDGKCIREFSELGKMEYEKGDGVYDTAWRAYQSVLQGKVLEKDDKDLPEAPKPSDLRLAFPPST